MNGHDGEMLTRGSDECFVLMSGDFFTIGHKITRDKGARLWAAMRIGDHTGNHAGVKIATHVVDGAYAVEGYPFAELFTREGVQ